MKTTKDPTVIALKSSEHIKNLAVVSSDGDTLTFYKYVIGPGLIDKETFNVDNFKIEQVYRAALSKTLLVELYDKLKKLKLT